jgi:hypothetical protein
MIRPPIPAIAVITLALSVVAAEQPVPAVLKLKQPDGQTHAYKTLPPNAARLLFPEGTALLQASLEATSGGPKSPFASGGARTVTISDMAQRFEITGVVLRDELYLFDELFCDENPAVMGQLMRASGTNPKTADAALALASEYISLSFYSGEDSRGFILSSADEVTVPTLPPVESREVLRPIVHEPRVTRKAPGYWIDLFAKETGGLFVHHWQMRIDQNGLSEVTDHVVFPNYESRHRLIERAKGHAAPANARKVEFEAVLMGNGFTKDGGETDLQEWAASEGPGVSRTHVYYNSKESAESLFRSYLHDAVAVVEKSTWSDSDSKPRQPKALLISASNDVKYLYARLLFLDQSSVLMYTCSCLETLRASQR